MNRIPKYQQIMDWIHKRIESGELRVGDRLETEAELSEKEDLSYAGMGNKRVTKTDFENYDES